MNLPAWRQTGIFGFVCIKTKEQNNALPFIRLKTKVLSRKIKDTGCKVQNDRVFKKLTNSPNKKCDDLERKSQTCVAQESDLVSFEIILKLQGITKQG